MTIKSEQAKELEEAQTAEQFVRELDWLTTKEFCEKYNIEIPSWKGNVQLAASEFIRLDAIKWNMTKEFVKHGIKNSTTTPKSDTK